MQSWLHKIKNFQASENLVQTWVKWREQFTLFLIATEAVEKREKVKTFILLTCICHLPSGP